MVVVFRNLVDICKDWNIPWISWYSSLHLPLTPMYSIDPNPHQGLKDFSITKQLIYSLITWLSAKRIYWKSGIERAGLTSLW